MLTQETIEHNRLIYLPDDRIIFNKTGCDLTVGSIYILESDEFDSPSYIKAKLVSKELKNNYVRLQPGGLVVLFSREMFRLPESVFCFVVPKNSLSNQGIYVFNSGIIDPGFLGPISAIACNLSGKDCIIKPKDSFFRVVFQTMEGVEISKRDDISDESLKKERELYIEKHLADMKLDTSFSDIDSTIRNSVKYRIEEEWNNVFHRAKGELNEKIAEYKQYAERYKLQSEAEYTQFWETAKKEIDKHCNKHLVFFGAAFAIMLAIMVAGAKILKSAGPPLEGVVRLTYGNVLF